jgi:hypothetical protein
MDLMTTEPTTERPTTLSVGIVMSVVMACLTFFCVFVGAGVFGVVGGLVMVEEGAQPVVVGLLGGLACLVIGVFFLFQLLTLYAGWRAWAMDKTWIWVLLVLSALSMLNAGMLTLATGVVTIVGCVQALERIKAA